MQSKTSSITATIGIGAIFGFAGLFALPLNGWVGGILFVIGISILLSKFILPTKAEPTIPPQHTIVSEFEMMELPEELRGIRYAQSASKPKAGRETFLPLLM